MTCSAIYTVNQATSEVPVDGIIPLGTTVRRFGRNITQEGNGILLCGQGYYKVTLDATIAPTDAGTPVVTLLSNGVPILGSEASVQLLATAPGMFTTQAIVRNRCCDDRQSITAQLTGAASTVSNISVIVEKL